VGAKSVRLDSPKLEVHTSKGETYELDFSETLKLVAEHSQHKKSLKRGCFQSETDESKSRSVGHQL